MTETDDRNADAPSLAAPDIDTSTDLILDTLWSRVLEAWDDDKTHGSFIEYCIRAEKLPHAAASYRRLKDDPEKGERAQKKLDAVVIAATQMLLAMKTPARTKPPRTVLITAWIVTIALMCWLAFVIHGRR